MFLLRVKNCDVPRSSSGRSYIRPLGFTNLPWVQQANIMVSRVVLLMLLVAAQQSTFVIEQPRGSLMRRHPRYVWFVRKLSQLGTPVMDLQIDLGSFFAASQKPLTLSSNNGDFLQTLWDKRPSKFLQRIACLKIQTRRMGMPSSHCHAELTRFLAIVM